MKSCESVLTAHSTQNKHSRFPATFFLLTFTHTATSHLPRLQPPSPAVAPAQVIHPGPLPLLHIAPADIQSEQLASFF